MSRIQEWLESADLGKYASQFEAIGMNENQVKFSKKRKTTLKE
jgi:hypothetical protein